MQHLGETVSLWRCAMQRLSESERVELWDRWEAGESQRSIARALGRSPSTVRTVLVSSRWRRPVPPREWSSLRLSLVEREEISRGIAEGLSLRAIATGLGRSPSTVCREVAANGGRSRYRAVAAHRSSRIRAKRPKPMKLGTCPRSWRRSWRVGGHRCRSHAGGSPTLMIGCLSS